MDIGKLTIEDAEDIVGDMKVPKNEGTTSGLPGAEAGNGIHDTASAKMLVKGEQQINQSETR